MTTGEVIDLAALCITQIPVPFKSSSRPHSSTRTALKMKATVVLCDPCLLQSIVAFQDGLPKALVDTLADSCGTGPGNLTLAQVAIRTNNLRLLQLVYRCYQAQPLRIIFGMHTAWSYALERESLAALEWLHTLPVIQHQRVDRESVTAAMKLTDPAVIAWLLEHRPVYKAYMLESSLRRVVGVGNLVLLEWLIANIPDVPITAATMDTAAEYRRLHIVQYLHANRTEGCTTAAMDLVIIREHREIARFLLENRTEGCSLLGLRALKHCSRSMHSGSVGEALSRRYAREWRSLDDPTSM